MGSIVLNYLILTFLNINPIFGGKLLAVGYVNLMNLNPLDSLTVIILTEAIVCALFFHFANYLRKFKFFNHKLNGINQKWVQKGSYIGFFIGQFFVGEMFIAFLLGLIEDKKNQFLYFYVPMLTSTIAYTLIYYYLAFHGFNLIKDYAIFYKQIVLYKKFIKII